MTKETLLQRDIKLLKEQQNESITLFKELDKEVGLMAGEKIAKHLAKLQGIRFNEHEYNMADVNGEQGV
jgi:hypothetical protein